MSSPINFIDLKQQYAEIKASIDSRIQQVLDHGQYIMGPEMRELEQKLSKFIGADHCICVASGTEALLIALMALGLRAGDEVITTSFTFVATAEVIALTGATPVFVDIQADTYNIEPSGIEAAITPRTKAIMPVSLYGQVADLDEINRIAARHGNIPVIEDAAQSFGASYKGRKSCNLSTIGCTSFFPSKPLGCYGDGGAIFTNDAQLAERMRQIRVHGDASRYQHVRIGVGGRMDTIQCAVLLAKLERFQWEIQRRFAIGRRYLELLDAIPGIVTPVIREDRDCVFAQFTLQCDAREALLERLKKAEIPTAIHYPVPLHKQPAYREICRIHASLDHSERASARVFSLPMHPYLEPAAQDRIVRPILDFAS